MNPAPDERDRICAAMDRILSGTAQHSNGALTIVALALEAEVPRNALTQRHTDLKAEFYTRVAERGEPSEVETRLRATIAALKKTIGNKNAELAQLRADVPALVRAVNQLTLQNQELREALASPNAEIIPIRRGRSRYAED
jgi:septal ring factor EnvC (AmiA/AmiB activator)